MAKTISSARSEPVDFSGMSSVDVTSFTYDAALRVLFVEGCKRGEIGAGVCIDIPFDAVDKRLLAALEACVSGVDAAADVAYKKALASPQALHALIAEAHAQKLSAKLESDRHAAAVEAHKKLGEKLASDNAQKRAEAEALAQANAEHVVARDALTARIAEEQARLDLLLNPPPPEPLEDSITGPVSEGMLPEVPELSAPDQDQQPYAADQDQIPTVEELSTEADPSDEDPNW